MTIQNHYVLHRMCLNCAHRYRVILLSRLIFSSRPYRRHVFVDVDTEPPTPNYHHNHRHHRHNFNQQQHTHQPPTCASACAAPSSKAQRALPAYRSRSPSPTPGNGNTGKHDDVYGSSPPPAWPLLAPRGAHSAVSAVRSTGSSSRPTQSGGATMYFGNLFSRGGLTCPEQPGKG